MPDRPTLDAVLAEVHAEVARAESMWPPQNSAHEGYAVILEEMDELKEHVWMNQKRRDVAAMRKEAIEVSGYWQPGYPAHGKTWHVARSQTDKKRSVTLLVLNSKDGRIDVYEHMIDAPMGGASMPRAPKGVPADKAEPDAQKAHRAACAALAAEFEPDTTSAGGGPLDKALPGLSLATLSSGALRYMRIALAESLVHGDLDVWDLNRIGADAAAFLRALGITLQPAIRVEGEIQ